MRHRRKDVYMLLQAFKPYLSTDICKYIYSFICPGKCAIKHYYRKFDKKNIYYCKKCGIGCKYHYYDKYKKSISIIQRWLNNLYFSDHTCNHVIRTHQSYSKLFYIYCKKKILKKDFYLGKSLRCNLHKF
jgi:hypothetical protein